MQIDRRVGVFAVIVLFALAVGASAQMGMGMHTPQMQGVWRPVVGSGAAYDVETKGEHGLRKSQIEMAIVDKEIVDGKTGYWLEWTVLDLSSGSTVHMKQLIMPAGKDTVAQRMIMQAPDMPQPIEMSTEMDRRGGRRTQQAADVREKAERVGSESITTPAGTFQCEHLQMKDGSGEVWISDKVAPWGLVKTVGKESNMTLTRLITGAKTRITGTPQKLDLMEMMRKSGKP
ncbi:MAG: hypothetical protein HY237_02425 [Acidobacteria bacterium]|nr:hypothetical protein [Acidobacteriota bacterium]